MRTKKGTSWAVLLYGFLIAGLGYMGYAKAGSQISLYIGSGFGGLLVLSSILMFYHIQWGAYAALLLTFTLTATFAIRYSMTGKELPALLAVLSGGMLLFLIARTFHWKR
jgi:uncharacterized membrane protein (UPF0136 family)